MQEEPSAGSRNWGYQDSGIKVVGSGTTGGAAHGWE